jgi:hypothetical protein
MNPDAFAADPRKPSVSALPQAVVKDGYPVIEFTVAAEDMAVTHGAAWPPGPGASPWQMLAGEGAGNHHLFGIPVEGKAGFMRLHVTPR